MDKTQKKIWKQRIDSIIYGLVYPAFFGNMVYDVINIYFEKDEALVFSISDSIVISALIMAFVVVDFMHLNGDVNTTYNKPQYKSRYYFACDFITPILLFTAFELLRIEKSVGIGILIFCLTPASLLIYKSQNPHSKVFFWIYAIVSFLIGGCFLIWKQLQSSIYLEIVIFAILATYFVYMVCKYPNKSRDYDTEYVAQLIKQEKESDS